MSHRDETLSRLRPFGIVFEKSLNDLIRGIRVAKDPQAREGYLRQALADCQTEVRSPDMDTKTMAVLKLAYLEMYGYDMTWASFHVLEVMSSAKFQQKRVGYMAAMQSFRTDTDVLMLTTNLFKKDLGSSKYLDVSVSLSGIATMVTPSLAHDLSDDIIKMLTHSRPYIRKKAVLALYNVILQYPEALKAAFSRLKDRLNDSDSSVVSAAVNVICELAKQTSTKTFLSLAPQLYELLTTSKNNWMLIKILKLFSSLAPREPRLKSKLLPPILQLMDSTSAMSLLYECINCLVSGGMLEEDDYELAAKCVGKLTVFLEESDQNLKYVGLLALTKVVSLHPQFLSGQQSVILSCIDDGDLTIREQVLTLLSGTADEDNLYYIVNKLMDQLRDGSGNQSEATTALENLSGSVSKSPATELNSYSPYRIQAIRKIIQLCSTKTYQLIPDFDWYLGILVEMVSLAPDEPQPSADPHVSQGALIGEQFRDIAVRVKSVRENLVSAADLLLQTQVSTISHHLPSVLFGTVWTLGEYCSALHNPLETIHTLLNISQQLASSPAYTDSLPPLSAVFIQAIMKIYTWYAGNTHIQWSRDRSHAVKEITTKIERYLESNSISAHFEVQERAAGFLELLKVVQQGIDEHDSGEHGDPPLLLSVALPSLFNVSELTPVAKGAQKRVPVPKGLDLDSEIFPGALTDETSDDDYDDFDYDTFRDIQDLGPTHFTLEQVSQDPVPEVDVEKQRIEREKRLQNDPFYLGNTPTSTPSTRSGSPSLNQQTLSNGPGSQGSTPMNQQSAFAYPQPRRAKVEILLDDEMENDAQVRHPAKKIKKKSLLQSRLRDLNLSEDESQAAEAQNEVDRIRQSLAASTVTSSDVEVVHKKLKSKKGDGLVKKKKKKTEIKPTDGEVKKKKKKKPALIEG